MKKIPAYAMRTQWRNLREDRTCIRIFARQEGQSFSVFSYYDRKPLLPDFDPRDYWSFYNPPLYHILCAVLLKITHAFGVTVPACYESIQCVNLLFSSLTVWLAEKIFAEFDLEDRTAMLFTAVFAFHPFFLLFSAQPTNDMLAASL